MKSKPYLNICQMIPMLLLFILKIHMDIRLTKLVDDVSQNSNSIIVNRASYKENLENIRSAIKELGKYELRKFELNRQKKLLALKKDEKSKQRLKRLERFTTTNNYDFTHVLIADYGIRLLQVAPFVSIL